MTKYLIIISQGNLTIALSNLRTLQVVKCLRMLSLFFLEIGKIHRHPPPPHHHKIESAINGRCMREFFKVSFGP